MTAVTPLLFYFPLIFIFLFGCIIGSFLGVVSYRLHTGRSLNGSSHCESCGHQLRFYELFPVLSFLALRGKCLDCGSYIPRRHLYVELLTGFTYTIVGYYTFYSGVVEFSIDILLATLLILILVYDIRHLIVPDELVISVGVVALLLSGYQLMMGQSISILLLALMGAVVAGGSYGALWWFTGGKGMGFGDVKLAIPLGFILGLQGSASFIVLSFWIGAIVSLSVLAYQRIICRMRYGYSNCNVEKTSRYLTMKSEIPFAPFIIIAFMAVYLSGVDVFVLTNYVLEGFTNF